MKLGNIIKNCGMVTTKGDLSMEINGLTSDSRKVVPGTMFIAVKGFAGDGHKFISSALAKGAAAIMYEDPQELEAQVNAARHCVVSFFNVSGVFQCLETPCIIELAVIFCLIIKHSACRIHFCSIVM